MSVEDCMNIMLTFQPINNRKLFIKMVNNAKEYML